MSTTPHINTLREHLLETLAELRRKDAPMEPDRARAIAQVASVLVDSAKVEVDYLRATGQDAAPFLEAPPEAPRLPDDMRGDPPILTGLRVHRLKG